MVVTEESATAAACVEREASALENPDGDEKDKQADNVNMTSKEEGQQELATANPANNDNSDVAEQGVYNIEKELNDDEKDDGKRGLQKQQDMTNQQEKDSEPLPLTGSSSPIGVETKGIKQEDASSPTKDELISQQRQPSLPQSDDGQVNEAKPTSENTLQPPQQQPQSHDNAVAPSSHPGQGGPNHYPFPPSVPSPGIPPGSGGGHPPPYMAPPGYYGQPPPYPPPYMHPYWAPNPAHPPHPYMPSPYPPPMMHPYHSAPPGYQPMAPYTMATQEGHGGPPHGESNQMPPGNGSQHYPESHHQQQQHLEQHQHAQSSQERGPNQEANTKATRMGIMTGRNPIPLYMTCDDESLSAYQCLVRKQIELFEARSQDVESNAQGRNKPIVMGQVGIRCRHCTTMPPRHRARASVYYPAKLLGLYQAAQNMATIHLCQHCQRIPPSTRSELFMLRERKSSAGGGKKYWGDGARVLGVYEGEDGLRFEHNISTHM